ncbi:UvrD-helicase domain-containing protein [Treponema primitia]|uniref:UvrD-helicase domain-containing protein n=1 Tax=Treponema primitia TaxID=88058 RepID=UPI0002554CEF|nr:UvrD-helicase domain-containing protein [Treponema primitia]
MHRIIADLHLHSPYSRATSKRNSPAFLDRWAQIKGINLAGTGDCTHPQWLADLQGALVEAEEGFYTLKEDIRRDFDRGPALEEGLPHPANGDTPVRFVLTGEISTIYTRGTKTRKVHHLILLPSLEAAAAFQVRLERVGNIRSDGRPILGLDSRDLLELLLESDPRSLLIPAHIWTPWFSVLGARSGFDSIDECYRDLAPHIHAIETGLSSNPPMNWALSSLDRFAIISNSDAHSPNKLGREATIFEMDPSYPALAAALAGVSRKTAGPALLETLEFFPQEGKYHYDGHRSCDVCLSPEESAATAGSCPVCGQALTPGVLGRVRELADRPVSEDTPCPPEFEGTNRRPYRSLIPLEEILGEIIGVGLASKKVTQAYGMLIEKAGSEFAILMDRSIGDLEKLNCPGISGELLSAAIDRMRKGAVSITPGYDGIYGIIRAFPQRTLARRTGGAGAGLFGEEPEAPDLELRNPTPKPRKSPDLELTGPASKPRSTSAKLSAMSGGNPGTPPRPSDQDRFIPDPDQERAINHSGGPALIIAGPGTGKTAVLARSIARLMDQPEAGGVLALSFTVKAAEELRERIKAAIENRETAALTVGTFHSLGRSILKAEAASAGLRDDFTILDEEGRAALLKSLTTGKKPRVSAERLGLYIEERKRFLLRPGDTGLRLGPAAEKIPEAAVLGIEIPPLDTVLDQCYREYRDALKAGNTLDFDDLLAGTVRLLAAKPELLAKYQERFANIFADEYQDINFAQYALLRLLAREEIRVIGDPNQAIYGFRGASNRYMERFLVDYPGAAVYGLSKSFRCAEPIIRAANRLTGTSLRGNSAAVCLYRTPYPTDRAEAEGIARRIAALIGGTGFFAIDSGVVTGADSGVSGLSSLGQCAILIRAAALAPPIEEALKNHGIPYRLMGENLEDIRWTTEEVALMTIHASKGLEFDHVFVSGLEEGILPFTLFGENKKEDIAEEQRLLYVAMTRARRGLHLSWAASRSFRGRILTQPPSRFLAGLESLIPELKHGMKRGRDGQLDLFS